MTKIKLLTAFLFITIAVQAQTDSPKVYKGFGGDYTYEDFKSWRDSTSCEEEPYVLNVARLQNRRETGEGEKEMRKSLRQAFPLLIHVSEPEKGIKMNGYLKVFEGGGNMYLIVNKSEKKMLQKLPPETVIYCATPKQRLKANQTEVRFLVEKNMDELDVAVRNYLKANSLTMLTAFGKDVEDCDNPHVIKIDR